MPKLNCSGACDCNLIRFASGTCKDLLVMCALRHSMDAKEIILSVIMVASSFFLASSYLAEYERSNSVILASTVLLIASLAIMLLSTNDRLRRLEREMEKTGRGTRIRLQSLEDRIDSVNSPVAESGGFIKEE